MTPISTHGGSGCLLCARRVYDATKMNNQGYFVSQGSGRFNATAHVGGAWFTDEQHIAPLLGLLTHLVEVDLPTTAGEQGGQPAGACVGVAGQLHPHQAVPGGPDRSHHVGSQRHHPVEVAEGLPLLTPVTQLEQLTDEQVRDVIETTRR